MMKHAGRRIEAIVILRRIEEIVTEAGLRRYGERRRYGIVRIEFNYVVFGLIRRLKRGLDHAQIARLRCAGIGIDVVDVRAPRLQPSEIR